MVVSKNPIWQQCELALNSLQETSARETWRFVCTVKSDSNQMGELQSALLLKKQLAGKNVVESMLLSVTIVGCVEIRWRKVHIMVGADDHTT